MTYVLDALFVAALAGELDGALAGARIDAVTETGADLVQVSARQPGANLHVVLACHGDTPYVAILPVRRPSAVAQPSAFVMLLRKYLEGGRVRSVRAPIGERLIEIACERGGPLPSTSTLIIELLSRRGNIVLLNDDDHMILGALRQHHVAGARAVAPHVRYQPPRRPPVAEGFQTAGADRPSVLDISAGEWASISGDQARERVMAAFAGAVAGVSAAMAEECVARAEQSSEADVLPIVRGLWREALEGPALAVAVQTADNRAVLLPFQPVLPWRALAMASSPSQLCLQLLEASEPSMRHRQRAVLARLHDLDQRLVRKHEALARQQRLAADDDLLLLWGNLLLAHARDVPAYAASVSLPDFDTGLPVEIRLDSRLSGPENAARFYREAARKRRAVQQIPVLMAEVDRQRAFTADLVSDASRADSERDLRAIEDLASEYLGGRLSGARATPPSKKAARQAKGQPARPGGAPLRRRAPGGEVVLVGRNARQNEEVTFHDAGKDDLWLHARGAPGAHVVLRTGGHAVSEESLRYAAQLAAYYSDLRAETSAPVAWTRRSGVRKAPGGMPGQVLAPDTKTVFVRPGDPEREG